MERIAQTIEPDAGSAACDCVHALDVYIQFPNGRKRPDISIFCREPADEEQDSALTLLPKAVVETPWWRW